MNINEKEFAHMLRKHKSTIYTVCYMFSDNKEEVEDIFQEVCINLWKGFAKFRGDAKISTWIWRVSLNTCLTWQKQQPDEHVALDLNLNLFADDGEDIRQIRMLYNRVHRLGIFDRAILLLWLDNMSYDEIGQMLGISAKNVSVKLVRIKQLLKEMSDN